MGVLQPISRGLPATVTSLHALMVAVCQLKLAVIAIMIALTFLMNRNALVSSPILICLPLLGVEKCHCMVEFGTRPILIGNVHRSVGIRFGNNPFLLQSSMMPRTLNYFKGCRSGEFRCQSGQCIPEAYRCNERYDCNDRSDEWDCGKGMILVNALLRTSFCLSSNFI